MLYIIEKIECEKKGFTLLIKNQNYLIDEYIYKVILPYQYKQLDMEQLNLIIAFSNAHNCLKKLYKKVFNNEVTKFDLRCELKKNNISSFDIKTIIDQFIEDDYLDENEFIKNHINKFQKNKGKKTFEEFLVSHKVDNSLIYTYLDDYQENEDFVLNYINQHLKTNTGSKKMFIYKVKNNLLNKGFSSSLIDKCLSKINIYEKKDNLINDFNKLLKKYDKNDYKIILKLVNKGYNVEDVRKIVKGGNQDE